MDREHLCDSLIIWLQTFNVTGPQSSVEDLTDGVAMAQVLNQIAPSYFDSGWLSKIKTDTSSNWRLKVSNLKKVLKGILDYNVEILGQNIHDFSMPDVNEIGEHQNSVELGRLLQLILGCAVSCDAKQEYIQRIMALEESVQHVVMTAIQELMTKESPTSGTGEPYSEIGEQLKRTLDELQSTVEQKEELAQRCHELDLQVAHLQEERSNLASENERLNERINQAENLEDPRTWEELPDFVLSSPAGRRYQQLQTQVEHLQEELYRMEAARDDYRIKVDLQETEILELQQKNEEMHSLAQEASLLKDEVDILRMASEKVAKYEASVENYKKKLEEMGDLKAQLKMLEDKNTSYMQTNMELEEELKKTGTVRSQLELYKRQSQELQITVQEEAKRADKAEFEAKRAQDKLQATIREKERLVEERDSLKDINEELRCSQVQQAPSLPHAPAVVGSYMALSEPISNDGSLPDEQPELGILTPSKPNLSNKSADSSQMQSGEDGGIEMMNLPPEVKEKFLRLQHENKMLKLEKTASSEEQTQLLQSMLDDSRTVQSELQANNRLLNQRILELEAQIEDLQESQQKSESARSEDHSELRRRLTEQSRRGEAAETEASRLKARVEELEVQSREGSTEKARLEEALRKKEEDMQAMEAKYIKYLEKAKSVISSMNTRNNSSGSSPIELQSLKNQLQEKDRLLKDLHREQDKTKAIREQEEKLMVTAWHSLGLQLAQRACEDRLSTSTSQGQSFLARQRQAQTRRTHSMASSPLSASGSR